jgi:hydrogenase expression/formation protein HypC
MRSGPRKGILKVTVVCLIVPSRVVAVRESDADVELADGQRTIVSNLVTPGVDVGDYVLVDRGFIIQAITADEARAIIELYAEMNALASTP